MPEKKRELIDWRDRWLTAADWATPVGGAEAIALAARNYVMALDAPEPPDEGDYYEAGKTSDEYLADLRAALRGEVRRRDEPPTPTRALYSRLAAEYEAEAPVPDRRGGVPGDRYSMEAGEGPQRATEPPE